MLGSSFRFRLPLRFSHFDTRKVISRACRITKRRGDADAQFLVVIYLLVLQALKGLDISESGTFPVAVLRLYFHYAAVL